MNGIPHILLQRRGTDLAGILLKESYLGITYYVIISVGFKAKSICNNRMVIPDTRSLSQFGRQLFREPDNLDAACSN
jgi:hypothetical protein